MTIWYNLLFLQILFGMVMNSFLLWQTSLAGKQYTIKVFSPWNHRSSIKTDILKLCLEVVSLEDNLETTRVSDRILWKCSWESRGPTEAFTVRNNAKLHPRENGTLEEPKLTRSSQVCSYTSVLACTVLKVEVAVLQDVIHGAEQEDVVVWVDGQLLEVVLHRNNVGGGHAQQSCSFLNLNTHTSQQRPEDDVCALIRAWFG